jgi:hypothetical protein
MKLSVCILLRTNAYHANTSTINTQTKTFTAYKTLDECLRAGGRMPKR